MNSFELSESPFRVLLFSAENTEHTGLYANTLPTELQHTDYCFGRSIGSPLVLGPISILNVNKTFLEKYLT